MEESSNEGRDEVSDINKVTETEFEFNEFIFTRGDQIQTSGQELKKSKWGSGRSSKDARLEFLEFVDRSLKFHLESNSDIHKFRLWLYSDLIDPVRIDHYISVAVSHRVQELELDFSGGYVGVDIFDAETHNLPQCLYSCESINVLKLRFCSFNNPTFTGFSSLKTIYLVLVRCTVEQVEDMFHNCPVLENFSMKRCLGFPFLTVSGLKILPLKSLEIAECWDVDSTCAIQSVHIDAPNLVYFRYVGTFGEFKIMNASSLANAVLENINHFGDSADIGTVGQLLRDLRYTAESLSLCGWCVEALVSDEMLVNLLPLDKLKHLKLETTLSCKAYIGITSLLESSPNLEQLSIDITSLEWFPEEEGFVERERFWIKQRLPFACMQRCLKKVEIHGFTLRNNNFEMLKFLIQSAMVLDELIVNHWIDNEFVNSIERSLMINKASQHAKIVLKGHR